MQPQEVADDINLEAYETEYLKPIQRVGKWTCLAICVSMLLPSALLFLLYGVFPTKEAILAGLALGFTFTVPFYFVEPIAYYPIVGDAGWYVCATTGNGSNLRVPCGVVAQEVAGVKEGSRKGLLIAAIGIGVSVVLGIIGVGFGAIGAGWLKATFPAWLVKAFNTYLLPAVFGAVFGEFALRGMKYAIVPLILTIVPGLLKWPSYVVNVLAVLGTIFFGWFMYKQFGWGAPKEEAKG